MTARWMDAAELIERDEPPRSRAVGLYRTEPPKPAHPKHPCPDCGRPVVREAKRCLTCAGVLRRRRG